MAANTTVLVIEDESSIRDVLRFVFNANAIDMLEAEDAETGFKILAKQTPDLILLDCMLPRMSGMEVVKRLRENAATKTIPIIMLTARAEEEMKVKALTSGADDYIVKPFSSRELIARIQAVLRRRGIESTSDDSAVLRVDGLVLDAKQHLVVCDEKAVELRPLEFRLLHFFMMHPNRVYSRSQLLDYVWGNDAYVDERTIDVAIRRLRQALQPGGYKKLIKTVHGAGYKFITS